MKFYELKARNFMRFLDLTLPLADQGLVLILGENRDAPKASSNGASKSALLEALCWCLWGKTIRGLKDDEVINESVGRDCLVSVSLTDGKSSYLIERHRKNSKHKKPNDLLLFVDGESVDGASMTVTQQRINELLGLDFDTFRCMMPGAGIKVAELTDAVIKEHLENILQTKVISKAHDLTKSKIKELKFELDKAKSDQSRIELEVTNLESSISQYKASDASFEVDRANRIAKIDADLLEVSQEIQACCDKLNKLTKLEATVKDLEDQVAIKEAKVVELKNECQTIAETGDKVAQEYLKKIIAVDLEVDYTAARLEELKSLSSTCDKCSQGIDEQHKAEQVTLVSTARNSLLAKKVDLVTRAKEAQRIKDEALSVPKAQQAELQEAVVRMNSDLLKHRRALIELGSSRKVLELLNGKQEVLQASKVSLQKESSPYAALLENAVKRYGDLVKSLEALVIKIEDLTKGVEDLEFWQSGFSSKGIKSYMLSHVAPILEDRANHYANVLTDGEMKIEFYTEKQLKNKSTKDEFGIKVTQAHGASNYTGNSTGERGRADLAIALALGDLAAKRAHKHLPLRFLDEPFESIDDAGHESIIKLLSEQTQYETVFCITHKEAFQQLFPKSIRVVKENGVSTLETDSE